jgi:hypothetical protein
LKRDGDPHRSTLLTVLAQFTTAVTWITVSFFPFLLIVPGIVLSDKKARRDPVQIGYCLLCLIPPVTAIGCACVTRSLAARDLKRMRTGDMDRRGLPATEEAWSAGRAALWIGLVGPICWAILLGIGFLLLSALLAMAFSNLRLG